MGTPRGASLLISIVGRRSQPKGEDCAARDSNGCMLRGTGYPVASEDRAEREVETMGTASMRLASTAMGLVLVGCTPSLMPTPMPPTTTVDEAPARINVSGTMVTCAGRAPAAEKTTEPIEFGYLTYVDALYVYIDPAEYFEGDDAQEAARQDGVITGNQKLRNTYYIRNTDTTVVKLNPTDGFRLTYWAKTDANQGLGAEVIAHSDATSLYCKAPLDSPVLGGYQSIPVAVTVNDGFIYEASQTYLPKCCGKD